MESAALDRYQPNPVHRTYRDGQNGPVTAVGPGWTWVAQAAGSAGDAPFKILYTCFQARQPAKEAQFGVVSGGGSSWHRIGDPAETTFNNLESQPIVVGSGFQQAHLEFCRVVNCSSYRLSNSRDRDRFRMDY
jgi:hypothetical protein